MARSANVAVVLRRGPAEWTQCVRWDTQRDTFELGQWLHGRVYERRSDLSPSGDKLIYFVAKHQLLRVNPSYTRAWTAVSRPPYFTAIALWPNADTTYHGGGLFETDDHVLVNSVDHRFSNPERGEAARVHPDHTPPKRVRVGAVAFTSGDQLWPKRLVRDGWELATGGSVDADRLDPKGRLTRTVDGQRLELEYGYQRAEYRLFEKQRGRWSERPFEGVGWADFDPRGRLVFAREGKLWAAKRELLPDGLAANLLIDLDPSKPGRLASPPSARRW